METTSTYKDWHLPAYHARTKKISLSGLWPISARSYQNRVEVEFTREKDGKAITFFLDKREATHLRMKLNIMDWIPLPSVPPINEADDFNRENKISKRVMVYVPSLPTNDGIFFASYIHGINTWSIEGVHSSREIIPTHWMSINKP